jgi:hypothetical protein
MITALEEMIAGSDKLTVLKRAELRGKISAMPGLNRFLRVTDPARHAPRAAAHQHRDLSPSRRAAA